MLHEHMSFEVRFLPSLEAAHGTDKRWLFSPAVVLAMTVQRDVLGIHFAASLTLELLTALLRCKSCKMLILSFQTHWKLWLDKNIHL